MKSVTIKRISLILVFILLFSTSLWWGGYVLKIKRTDGVTTMQNLYAQPEDSCDVLFIGSSYAGMNLDMEVFWSDYGIPAYALWGSIQPFWNSYHFLLEALKTQTPEVVVLDVYAATLQYEYSDEARQETNVVGMKFGKNKIDAIMVSAPQERWLDMILEYPLYHSRISDLTMDDFMHFPWTEGLENNKGSSYRYGIGNFSLSDVSGITDVAPIYEKQELYLRKIIEKCQTENIPLLLVKTPTVWRAYEQAYYNHVVQIAAEYGIPFLNMNLMDAETGINNYDFWIDGHLNTNGARKASAWLGNYLKTNYSLTDHRGDPEYSSWDVFSHTIQSEYLACITNPDDYMNELIRNSFSVVIVKNSDWESTEAFEQLLQNMSVLGISEDIRNGSGSWLLTDASDGQLIKQSLNDLVSAFEFDDSSFIVGFKDSIGVQINGNKVYDLNAPGIAFIVYDSVTNRCLDVVQFMLNNNFVMERP